MKRFFLSSTFFLSLIILAGLFYRLYAYNEIRQDPVFDTYIPPHDSFYYIRAVQEFFQPLFSEPVSPYITHKLYQYFLIVLRFLSGNDLNFVRLFQIFLSLMAIPLIFSIGVRFGASRATGCLCAFFWALSPDLILYDLQILQLSLLFFLTLVALYGCLLFQEKPAWLRYFFALFCIFCLGQLRPFYYLLVFFSLYPFFRRFRNGKWLNLYYLFTVFAISACLAAFLLYGSKGKKTHMGIHMYFGFNKYTQGFYSNIPFIRDNTMGHMQEGVKLSQILSSRYPRCSRLHDFWLQKTFAFIIDNPFIALRLTLMKFYRLFFFRNWNDTFDIDYQRSHFRSQKPSSFFYWLLLCFGMIGFLSQFLSRPARYSAFFFNVFLFLPVFSVLASCLTIRYQFQLIPVLCVFAGYGAQVSYDLFVKDKRRFVFFGMIFLFVSILFFKEEMRRKDRRFYDGVKFSDYRIRTEMNQEADKAYLPYLEGKRRLSFSELEKIHHQFYYALNTTDAIGILKTRLKEDVSQDERYWCCIHLAESYEAQDFYEEAISWYQEAQKIKHSEEIEEKIRHDRSRYQRSVSPDSYW
ncbi:MAG: hypothetical protein JW774_09190 [Candidatus Aureabacteria bacterium]|nr:hypothetical protein [Candidatus Auribacterota bacterium]